MLSIIKNFGIGKTTTLLIFVTLAITSVMIVWFFYVAYGEVRTGDVLISLISPAILILLFVPKLIYTSFALHNAHEKAKIIDGTDRLTGFYNKSNFLSHLRREISSAKRYQKDVSIMLIKITNYQSIEQSRGRHVVEHVIKEASERVKKSFRKSDIISKYKEETFVVIMPETSLEKTATVKKRILELLEKNPIVHNGAIDISISVSIEPIRNDTDEENEDTVLNRLENE